MTNEQKLRCYELKQKNRMLLKEKTIKNINDDFKEISKLLGDCTYVLDISNNERLNIYEKCYDIFSFKYNASRLDESNLKNFSMYNIRCISQLYNNYNIFKECKYKYYYVICGYDYPIIKCDISKFFKSEDFIYEIYFKNSEGIILVSENFKQIIYIYDGTEVMIGEVSEKNKL